MSALSFNEKMTELEKAAAAFRDERSKLEIQLENVKACLNAIHHYFFRTTERTKQPDIKIKKCLFLKAEWRVHSYIIITNMLLQEQSSQIKKYLRE